MNIKNTLLGLISILLLMGVGNSTSFGQVNTVPASSPVGAIQLASGYGAPGGTYQAFDTAGNLAYQGNGAAPAVTKDYLNVALIHQRQNINDGRYGNGASWISNSINSWVKIDLGSEVTIDSLRFGRDRLGNFDERDPGHFKISVATSDMYANGDSTNDAAEYQLIFDSQTYSYDGVISGAQTIEAQFAPVVARYVKFEVTISGAAIDEIEIFGISNSPPTANAGPDQSIRAGDTVNLDGSGSDDDNTASASLVYSWSLTSPMGSSAVLTDAGTSTPSFVADVNGTYVVELVVTDGGGLPSLADEVEISSNNLAPTAAAGNDQLVILGNLVNLDGSGSSDPEMDALTYSWSIISAPGIIPALDDANTAMPSFTPVEEGAYVLSLGVSDDIGPGFPDMVEITVTSASGFAENRIVNVDGAVDSLIVGQVTTGGNQEAFGNFLSQAIAALQDDDVAKAIDKLEKAIERTDGCALRGSPDGNGKGRDWITDCAVQLEAYQLLNDALSALTAP
ncbi:MAG: PKD domain-containing protein [Acidobacteriota bacterium]|nr:PKD domain-containing protein [Acidobacteriota bacterium]MDH3531125.1 PKD domain-containing protein [Acidobacteriota bacterium]